MFRRATFATSLVLTALACGQVSGLSDDYQFDRVDSGPSEGGLDASFEGSVEDAPSEASSTCTAQAIAQAATTLSNANGSASCKTCLATSCCRDVSSCSRAADCKAAFDCKLDCTQKTDQRAQCLAHCTNGTSPMSYTTGIGACGGRSCTQECGFP